MNKSKNGAASPLKVTGLTSGKNYHCRVKATNAIGTGPFGAFGATVLVAATRPGCAAVTSSTPSAGAVSVAFSAPDSNGGSPITGYSASVCQHRRWRDQVQERRSQPAVVTGLTGAKHYHCRVKATNAIGTGPFGAYGATVLVPAARAAARAVSGLWR